MICSLQNHKLPARYESWQFPPKKNIMFYTVVFSRFLLKPPRSPKKTGHQHWQRKWQLKPKPPSTNQSLRSSHRGVGPPYVASRGGVLSSWLGHWVILTLPKTNSNTGPTRPHFRLTQASSFQMMLDVCLKEGETPPRPKTYKWNSHPSLMMVGLRIFFARDFALKIWVVLSVTSMLVLRRAPGWWPRNQTHHGFRFPSYKWLDYVIFTHSYFMANQPTTP